MSLAHGTWCSEVASRDVTCAPVSTLHAPALLGSAGRCFQNSLLFLQIARKQKQNLRYAQMPNIPIMLEQIHTSEQQLQQN